MNGEPITIRFAVQNPDGTGCGFRLKVATLEEAHDWLASWLRSEAQPDSWVVMGLHASD